MVVMVRAVVERWRNGGRYGRGGDEGVHTSWWWWWVEEVGLVVVMVVKVRVEGKRWRWQAWWRREEYGGSGGGEGRGGGG